MLLPPVITTVVNDKGIYALFIECDVDPNIYPKCIFSVPSLVAPTNGIVMLVKPLQPKNALTPMLVTLSGIVMLVMLLQF